MIVIVQKRKTTGRWSCLRT